MRASVRHELIWETAPKIFLKLDMKLGDNKGKKEADPFFEKNSHFAQIWPNVPKMAIFAQNQIFLAIKQLQQIF